MDNWSKVKEPDYTLYRGQFMNSYDHQHEAVYCVAAHPSSPEVVLTASEDGCVYIIDTRLPRREC